DHRPPLLRPGGARPGVRPGPAPGALRAASRAGRVGRRRVVPLPRLREHRDPRHLAAQRRV
ncbi:MAG: hypothetical protein AVDCRST_MAG68-495, partial [uncultured Gemmatimonadetes bacterium]